MRHILLLAYLLIPKLANAQFAELNDFKPGFYILRATPNTRQVGMLKLRNQEKLVVQKFRTKNAVMMPAEVLAFQIENKKYTVVEDFEVRADFGRRRLMGKIFLQQLDSGRIELMRYDYPPNPNGTRSLPSIYLLRTGGTLAAISGKWSGNVSEEFRTNLLPFIASRPDLVQLVESSHVRTVICPTLSMPSIPTNLSGPLRFPPVK